MRYLTALFILLLMACGAKVPLDLPHHELEVWYHMPISQLEAVRPSAHFIPYGGWLDTLPNDPLFFEVSYATTYDIPLDSTQGKRVWAVRYSGRSVLNNKALKAELHSAFGDAEVAGCASAPEHQYYQVITWPSSDRWIVGIVLADSTGEESGPMSMHVAKKTERFERVTRLRDLVPCRF